MEKRDYEFELRGKVISMCLKVENSLNQIIFDFFYPKFTDKKVVNIYLNKVVYFFTFDKKIELYKEISKTDRYKKKLTNYIESKKLIGNEESGFENYDEYINYLLKLLRKIQKNRNTIAHGFDMSDGFSNLKESEFILANKMNLEVFDEEFLNEYSSDTLKAHLMLTMIRLGID